VKYSLEELLASKTNICESARIVNKKFIVKKVAVLKQGTVLTHYIFMYVMEGRDDLVV